MADIYSASCRSCGYSFEYFVGPLMSGPRLVCQRCGLDMPEDFNEKRCGCGGSFVEDDGEAVIGHRCPKCDSNKLNARLSGIGD